MTWTFVDADSATFTIIEVNQIILSRASYDSFGTICETSVTVCAGAAGKATPRFFSTQDTQVNFLKTMGPCRNIEM
jgi:hypothetical protein